MTVPDVRSIFQMRRVVREARLSMREAYTDYDGKHRSFIEDTLVTLDELFSGLDMEYRETND